MSHDHPTPPEVNRKLVIALVVVFLGYGLSLGLGWPQAATRMIVEAESHASASAHHDSGADQHKAPAHSEESASETTSPAEDGHAEEERSKAVEDEQAGADPTGRASSEEAHAGHSEGAEATSHSVTTHPPLWMVVPFVALLLIIAVFPLLPQTEHWWESNLHRFYVAAALAAVTLLYYLVVYEHPVEGHWPAHYVSQPAAGLNWGNAWAVFANAIFSEFIPFIVLLFSLYTISGGIRIEGDLRATPLVNSIIIFVGAVLASFVGTTGAAMLLIRLLLDTNSERKHVAHTVVFFIFAVCNCGGCLLPTGDPPLFLGYLRGVPFLWTLQLWKEWAFVNIALIVIYFLWDTFWFYPHEQKRDLRRDAAEVRRLRVRGLWPNLPLMIGVVLGVALLDPSKPFPGTEIHPPLYLREIFQLGMVALSLTFGSYENRVANRFNYAAILEVAALFFGIFITMQPPLQILHVEGPRLGLTQPWQFFWATGALGSFLDNAPTYVVFFETARTLGGHDLVPPGTGVAHDLLVAVSLGAVFMGANTYIGNGPNFMVRAIAEKRGIKMPSFFGYMVYSGCILLPLFVLVTIVFLS
ncbi:MAG TPA: sodium:proton antiporter [Thermogutta sp.]|nr:sodium:proton antiporter [Thermogutta sp.]HPU06881.1 sodium:proton antiporter [Thermogutta sp.]